MRTVKRLLVVLATVLLLAPARSTMKLLFNALFHQ